MSPVWPSRDIADSLSAGPPEGVASQTWPSPPTGQGEAMTNSTKALPDHSPMREVVTYLAIVYTLTLAIAVTLPDPRINLLLSILVPTVAVTILTFTMFQRGTRRDLW